MLLTAARPGEGVPPTLAGNAGSAARPQRRKRKDRHAARRGVARPPFEKSSARVVGFSMSSPPQPAQPPATTIDANADDIKQLLARAAGRRVWGTLEIGFRNGKPETARLVQTVPFSELGKLLQ